MYALTTWWKNNIGSLSRNLVALKINIALFTAVLIACATTTQAQFRPSEKRYFDDSTQNIAPKFTKRFTSVVNVFTSGWTDTPPGISVEGFSPGYSFNGMYKQPIAYPYLTFIVGLGVAYTDYRFNGKVFYTENLDSTYFQPLANTEYKRNKMSLVFLDVPLELRIASRTKKGEPGWFIAPGFSGGLLINDYIKTTSEDQNGNRTKSKIYYTKNLQQQRYGATLRVGYGNFGLYGYYGLSELFEEGKGFGTNFYHVGLTIGGL